VNRDLSNGNTQMNAQSSTLPTASAVGSPAAWHRPAITIIDLKRTMAIKGGYLTDLGSGSS
jgi:hypothetical protein